MGEEVVVEDSGRGEGRRGSDAGELGGKVRKEGRGITGKIEHTPMLGIFSV